jgi:hypothetical protein
LQRLAGHFAGFVSFLFVVIAAAERSDRQQSYNENQGRDLESHEMHLPDMCNTQEDKCLQET